MQTSVAQDQSHRTVRRLDKKKGKKRGLVSPCLNISLRWGKDFSGWAHHCSLPSDRTQMTYTLLSRFTYTLLKSLSEMNSKVSPTLPHFRGSEGHSPVKKKKSVRQLQGTPVHICDFEPTSSLYSTASPCKQDDTTFYFHSLWQTISSAFLLQSLTDNTSAFFSTIFKIVYREISAKVSLSHWHVRKCWKYSPARKLATSTIYSFFFFFWKTTWYSLFPDSARLSNFLEYYLDLWKLHYNN